MGRVQWILLRLVGVALRLHHKARFSLQKLVEVCFSIVNLGEVLCKNRRSLVRVKAAMALTHRELACLVQG